MVSQDFNFFTTKRVPKVRQKSYKNDFPFFITNNANKLVQFFVLAINSYRIHLFKTDLMDDLILTILFLNTNQDACTSHIMFGFNGH